jgi:RND family efflux transporter MFP subunit
VRAEIVNVAPDVSGAIVELPVHDNQLVKKGDLIMQIDPSHYQIAVEQAQAAVAARRAELQMRRDDAARRADLDALVVSKENRENAAHSASSADAQYQQALAALDAAKLNLERTRVVAPVDGYITNLQTFKGNYAVAGQAKLAIVDSHSFWVYGYFEETKLPRVKIGAPAEMRLMSGGVMKGHVESISRGIYDRDNPQSRDLDLQLGAPRAARAGADPDRRSAGRRGAVGGHDLHGHHRSGQAEEIVSRRWPGALTPRCGSARPAP